MKPMKPMHPSITIENLAERERAYSPSSCIGGNYQPFIADYGHQSQLARARAEALGGRWLELRYGSAAAQRADLCLPPAVTDSAATSEQGCALLVFIHGGYWQELAARDSLFAAADCIERGVAFCALDYTLAPAAQVGDIVQECRQALLALVAQAAALGIDAQRIVVAGSSAGAHLAAMVCLPGWQTPTQPLWQPRAAVLMSGVYWLEPLLGTSINEALGMDAAQARAQSPALLDLQGFPPTLLCWGEVETEAFKAQSTEFAALLAQAGSTCQSMEIAGRNHFDVALELTRPHSPIGRHTLALLTQLDAG
jgi:arylformamidase